MLMEWSKMADEIAEEITRRTGFLKIILKTKNDEFFLADWIDHHAKIVGIENLIIADNGSDCETVHQLYHSYGKDLLSFSFSGNHNLIHSMRHYQKLYSALSKSTALRLFLDTDERLIWMDSNSWHDGREVLYRLKAAQVDGVMPTGLLSNLLGSATEFHFLGEFHQQSAWLWGKAIVPSGVDDRFVKDRHIERLHNCQFERDTFCSEFSANLNVLHLLNLDKQQRLKINKAKLVNFGIAKDEESYEMLAAREGDYGPPTRFIREIKNLLEWDGNLRRYDELPEGAIRLLPNHKIEVPSSQSEREFSDFIANGDRKIREILGLDSAEHASTTFNAFPHLAQASRSACVPSSLSLKPHMTDAEFALLSKRMDGAQSMLEYGCGGSTVLAGFHGIAKIVSVDSDQEWLDKVVEAPELAGANFLPIHVDIGPTGPWGFPTDKGHAAKWPNYYKSPWAHFSDAPDLVLIDGRFRVACALYSILSCTPNTTYVIHDFWNREYYHAILEFLDCIERADSLGVFVAKTNTDWRRLALVMSAHALDYQ